MTRRRFHAEDLVLPTEDQPGPLFAIGAVPSDFACVDQIGGEELAPVVPLHPDGAP